MVPENLVSLEGEFEEEDFQLSNSFFDIIEKVREVVSFFSRSPVSTDILIRHAQELGLKSVKLVSDVKTRWSSLSEMVKSFLKMKSAIQTTFTELEKSFNFTNEEIDKLDVIFLFILKINSTIIKRAFV